MSKPIAMSSITLKCQHRAHGAQEFDADLLIGDVAYACAMGQSELLRRGEGRGRLPRVMVSALPILDPLVPGRMENMPNNLAYVPQLGTSLSNRMVRPLQCMCLDHKLCQPRCVFRRWSRSVPSAL